MSRARPTRDGGYPRARKRFGQHFLRDRSALERIAGALDLGGTETVLEIGPGRGALTDLLVDRARRLVAIELDRDLAALLRERYATRPNVRIVEADVLETDLGALADGPYALVGNVPYYITTPILFHALRPPRPSRAVYLVQLEVAQRVVAAPGSKEYGALSVNVQGFARAEVLFRVPPGAFSPPPQVDSAVIRLVPRDDPVVPADVEERYRAFVIAAFGLRRKQMRRVLRTVASLSVEEADAVLAASRVDPEARPETLSPEDFARVVAALRAR
ncbi:Ribosomal RNA small subunit methyltransferase A [Gemmatirosa kalamazoonensis]|uniref:Ribosomal RNA small subunit methyltransferase A n=1 Tax=Gemmatirosa kalamazoonensis TaxID=861299 RepID=W0RIQ7_9BACT|nr:16S rRNA (adenine(1518)-N(6)/adenine(1519)-N(6))-dimethyltransferase RsmA [Gemmatirosa kalamazoonensis]AHG90989.1 Ribosomal RNA small subunit methyltransferase A [Gemmatirosa kalamazoonensis]